MAIDTWITVTLNTGTGVSLPAIATGAGADGGHFTMAYDSAVVTTQDQARACADAALQNIAGRLMGP